MPPARWTASGGSWPGGFPSWPTARTCGRTCYGPPATPARPRFPTPKSSAGSCNCLLRLDLHLDVPRPRLLDLRQGDGQHAMLVVRLDVAGVHGRGQREAALERAVTAFIPVHPLGALLGDLLLGAVDREHVVLDRDLHVLRL